MTISHHAIVMVLVSEEYINVIYPYLSTSTLFFKGYAMLKHFNPRPLYIANGAKNKNVLWHQGQGFHPEPVRNTIHTHACTYTHVYTHKHTHTQKRQSHWNIKTLSPFFKKSDFWWLKILLKCLTVHMIILESHLGKSTHVENPCRVRQMKSKW